MLVSLSIFIFFSYCSSSSPLLVQIYVVAYSFVAVSELLKRVVGHLIFWPDHCISVSVQPRLTLSKSIVHTPSKLNWVPFFSITSAFGDPWECRRRLYLERYIFKIYIGPALFETRESITNICQKFSLFPFLYNQSNFFFSLLWLTSFNFCLHFKNRTTWCFISEDFFLIDPWLYPSQLHPFLIQTVAISALR